MKGGDEGVVGNIEKRGENSYRLRVSAGYTDDGKRIMYKKTVQARNKSEARKELALFISEIETDKHCLLKRCVLETLLILGLIIMLFQIYLQKTMKDIKACKNQVFSPISVTCIWIKYNQRN